MTVNAGNLGSWKENLGSKLLEIQPNMRTATSVGKASQLKSLIQVDEDCQKILKGEVIFLFRSIKFTLILWSQSCIYLLITYFT